MSHTIGDWWGNGFPQPRVLGQSAVALAAQNIMGDLFAPLSIALDQPFVIGESMVLGELSGTVEHIGHSSTRIRSLSGEEVIVDNSDLLGTRIRNCQGLSNRWSFISWTWPIRPLRGNRADPEDGSRDRAIARPSPI